MNKKFLRIALLAFGALNLNAQFIENTDYVGALSPELSQDWTKTGWTNFDPKNANYAAVTDETTLAGTNGVKEITGALTLDASKVYSLRNIVAIKDGGSLTIPEGTLIRAESNVANDQYAMIIVERGGKIYVNGTAEKPVVITSGKAVGNRERGDWAGLLLFGKAKTNVGANQIMEGFGKVTLYQGGAGGGFGGTDNTDNSGVLKYLRLEFAGQALDINKEVNALTFGAVGSGTVVDYVQVSFSNDDSFEWFGGTVNTKHLIAFCGTDDDFDTDNGYSGLNQFGIGLKHPAYYDGTWTLPSNQSPSTSEGFESDNDANGSTKTPFTSAVFSNYTMVGPISLDSTYASTKSLITKGAFRRGARLRRNSKQSIVKTIFMGYRNFLMIDGNAALANYGVTQNPQVFRADSASYQYNFIHTSVAAQQFSATSNLTYNGLVEVANNTKTNPNDPNAPLNDTLTNGVRLNQLDSWIKDANNHNLINKPGLAWARGTVLRDPQNFTSPDFRPVSLDVLATEDVTYNVSLAGVYPNPVSSNEILNIASVEADYSLISATGVLVKAGKGTAIDMNGVEKGLYVLKVGANSTKVVVE